MELQPAPSDESTTAPVALRGLLFLVLFAMLVTGLWLMGEGATQESAALFVLGILASGVAFMVPLTLRAD
ncbi:MAG: hypothetical protein ACTMIR_02775 [Cellulomonadaceae bacterium]